MRHHFLSAVQFLTILPVKTTGGFSPKAAVPFFPLVGLLIGFLTAVLDRILLRILPVPAATMMDVIFLAAITGALHLDGLADTADGLYGQRPVDKALAIMKDSRVGAMGMVAVICCLGAKWGAIQGLASGRFLCLMLVPAFARAGVLAGMKFLPYGRPEGGTGRDFFKEPLEVSDFWGVWGLMGLSLLLGVKGAILSLGFIAVTGLILLYYQKKVNSITGDMLGALIEVNEASLLMLACTGGGG